LSSIVPRRRTSLVGRGEDRRRVAALLATPGLVTLTGPGGIGKTTLARAVLADEVGGGWFVDLSAVQAEDEAPRIVAAALGLVATEAENADAALMAYLRTRADLLVLDNVEQLPGIGHRVRRWLDEAPDLRVLTTSRMPLSVPGEVEVPVRGLGLPDGDTPDAVEASPAGLLFLQTARRLGALETVEPETARDLAVLLRRLDGMPLAIELAAGRSRVLSPSALLRRLDDPAVVSSAPMTGPAGRQASLDQVLAMTLDLLPAADRRLLAALTVCPGSFDLDLAQALAPDSPVLSAIDLLVGAGLAERAGEVAGETRFRLLETIRARAGRELTAADRAVARERHALATLAMAERTGQEWMRDEQRARARLVAEDDNLAAAIEWAVDHDTAVGPRLLVAFDGPAQEGVNLARSVRWYRAVLAGAPADDPHRLQVAGSLLRLVTRYAGPRDALELEPEVLAAVEDAPSDVRRTTYLRIAHAYYALGDMLAVARFDELAAGAAQNPDDAAALRLNAEATRAWVVDGDAVRAAALHRESAAADARAGRVFNQAVALFRCALLELRSGQIVQAVVQAREAVNLLPTGNVRAYASTILVLALAEHGDPGAARPALAAAWPDVEREARIDRLEVLEGAVALLAAEGRYAAAITARSVADRERPATGWKRDEHIEFVLDRWQRRAVRELGSMQATLAAADAESLTIEAAVAGALAPQPAPGGRRGGPVDGLTQREVEVLALVAQGRSDGEIAAELFISPKTASVHVANIKGKLGLNTRIQVALHARAIGLASSGSQRTVN
jgi:non-specific serine/threonine protein kinase